MLSYELREEIYLACWRNFISKMKDKKNNKVMPVVKKNNKVLVVARKEFLDSMTSKVFVAMFAIFLLLTLATTVMGINEYNKQLSGYQQSQSSSIGGDSAFFSDYPEPQVVNIVFGGMIEYIAIIGAILAIILGFNSISGEKKRGNLKTVLSYPLYRDNLINGKFLGKIGVLLLTLAISSFMGVMAVVVMGIKLTLGDFFAVLIFLLISSIYLIMFFGVSMLFSVFCKNDSSSLLFSMIVWLVAVMLMAPLATMAVNIIIPQEDFYSSPMNEVDGGLTDLGEEDSASAKLKELEFDAMFKKMEDRWKLESALKGMLSPTDNYRQIASAVVGGESLSKMMSSGYGDSIPSMEERLMGQMVNILILIFLTVVLLSTTYIKFMRQDIR